MVIPALSLLRNALLSDCPACKTHAHHARSKGKPVCLRIALQSLRTFPFPTRQNGRVLVVDSTVAQVEDVATHDRRECHDAPVHGHDVDAESVRDKSGVEIRVLDVDGADLGEHEDYGGDGDAPVSTHAESLD